MNTIEARFWAKVKKGNAEECWLWQGWTNGKGYGNLWHGPQPCHHILAHRLAWQLVKGSLSEGQMLHHRCEHRNCVNPNHMEVGTRRTHSQIHFPNSQCPAAINSRKTHCLRGHPFDAENTQIRRDGSRECRICNRDRARSWWRVNRGRCAEAPASPEQTERRGL